ncbi:unnamed protein product, partial [Symbiodinium pilosum]
FPGYDVAQKEEQHISVVATVKEKDGDTYANALQRAINLVRKAEARTRKAMADKKSRMVQWSNWVTELKKTYAKERGRYQAAVARHEREMEEALVEQECARSSLRKVAASMEVDAGPTTQEALDVGAEFEAIMQDGLGMEDYQESNEDILQRTLQHGVARREAASKQGTSAVGGRYYSASAQASTPLQVSRAQLPRDTQPPLLGATTASPGQAQVGTDPYMISHWSAKEVVYTGRLLCAKRLALASGSLDVPGQDIARGLPGAASEEGQPPAPTGGGGPPPIPSVTPQHHILYDDEEEKAPSESELEAWYNSHYGIQDLQTLE